MTSLSTPSDHAGHDAREMAGEPTHEEALLALLRTRRSVRRFRPEAPDEATIARLLDAAVLAPSASNKQPWRFLVVASRETIARMADAVRAASAEVASHVTPESRDAFRAYGDYFVRFEAAPIVVVPICRAQRVLSHLVDAELPARAREIVRAMERDSALAATSLALGNLLLAAHAAGLGASAMTGPLLARDALVEILGVPPGWDLVAVVPLGFPDEEPRPTERKQADKVTRWIR